MSAEILRIIRAHLGRLEDEDHRERDEEETDIGHNPMNRFLRSPAVEKETEWEEDRCWKLEGKTELGSTRRVVSDFELAIYDIE
jgi:hypothetical protein